MAGHSDTITINVTLDAAPAKAVGFSTVLLLVPLVGNSLNGVRVVEYTDLAGATADNTAGYISATTLAAVAAAFAQRTGSLGQQPASFKVGYIDLVGGETYATGLTACIAFDDAFYGVAITVRTDAEILLVSALVETLPKFFIAQSADADWLTAGGLPAALTALAARERTALIFHDTAAEWADVAWLSDRLTFDPDVKSATWNAAPNGVAVLSTIPTQAQQDFVDANFANLGLEFGSDTFYIDAGVNLAGRPIYEVLTADWFEIRLQEKVTSTKLAYALRGDKIQVNTIGSMLIKSLIDAQFDIGVKAGHFVEGQTAADMETVTAADKTAQRIRGGGRAEIGVDGRIFVLNFNFGRTALAAS